MKFRFHRGSYERSMETTVELNDIEELAEHLDITPDKVRITPYSGVDHRNGWNTHAVEVFGKYESQIWSMEGLSDALNF